MRIRNSIKINWLSVAASMLLVTVIGSVVLIFEFYTDDVYFKTRNFNYFLVFTLWFLFVLNYFVLEFLFNYYSKIRSAESQTSFRKTLFTIMIPISVLKN